ncbi:hypothetical protein O163_08075 [Caldanaerobacter subterraneus subsp. yonseiensis KB-1]|nr:hypothetical protein O163_08075 [Caldanaerobacter subterraneus subsp. yonseiensis KB-1]
MIVLLYTGKFSNLLVFLKELSMRYSTLKDLTNSVK